MMSYIHTYMLAVGLICIFSLSAAEGDVNTRRLDQTL